MSDELVDFLANTFLLNKDWISNGKGSSHNNINCDQATHFIHGIMQQSPYDLSLIGLFDNHILSNTNMQNNSQERREVYFVLIEVPILYGIHYKRMYLFKSITCDVQSSNITIASVLEGMEFQSSPRKNIELYAYSKDNVDRSNFGVAILTDFYGYGKTGVMIAEQPSKNVRTSKTEFTDMWKTLKLNLEEHLKIYKKCSGDLPNSYPLKTLLLLKDYQ